MAHTRRTAQKSTGRLAPRNVPPQQEPQHDCPREDEPVEIVVTVPAREDSQEAQPMTQNHDHDQREEENNEKEEEEGNKAEGEDDEDYTPWSNVEKDETFHDIDEIKTFGNKAPIPTGKLRDLLNRINITTLLDLESREFHTLAEKSTRQSWRSSADLMCSADTRDQPLGPLTRMQ
jgi:hypothetical protein